MTATHKKFVTPPKHRIFLAMAASQQMLFPPEKPLVKRLGRKFFRKIPRQAGVYKMHDAAGKIVYVGKAKDLRQRLASYRVAHPERLGRRHLKLLQTVTSIEFDLCVNESAALKHEAKLIRELKPRFNRAGVWPGRPQFLAWRGDHDWLELTVQETPLTGWEDDLAGDESVRWERTDAGRLDARPDAGIGTHRMCRAPGRSAIVAGRGFLG